MNLTDKFGAYLDSLGLKFTKSKVQDMYVREASKMAEASAALYASKNTGNPLRPSSALKCSRALYYGLCDFFNPDDSPKVEPLNFRQHRVFAYGHVIEDFEVGRINQIKGLQCTHQQLSVDICQIHGLQVRGSIDGILWKLRSKTPYLFDIKSINRYGFAEVVKSGRPKIEHYAQLNLYMCSPTFKDLMEEMKIPYKKVRGLIIYSNKDDQSIHWVEMKPSEEVFKATVDRFERVYDAYKAGEPSPRDFATLRYPCSYCAHYERCQGQPDPDLKLEVDFELNLDAAEEDLILTLWRRVGHSSTYLYGDKLLKIEKLKTKWKLSVHHADTGVQMAKARKAKAKTVPNKKGTGKRQASAKANKKVRASKAPSTKKSKKKANPRG